MTNEAKYQVVIVRLFLAIIWNILKLITISYVFEVY